MTEGLHPRILQIEQNELDYSVGNCPQRTSDRILRLLVEALIEESRQKQEVRSRYSRLNVVVSEPLVVRATLRINIYRKALLRLMEAEYAEDHVSQQVESF